MNRMKSILSVSLFIFCTSLQGAPKTSRVLMANIHKKMPSKITLRKQNITFITNGYRAQTEIINHINAAQRSIKCLMFYISDMKIITALKEAMKKGVQITLIFEHASEEALQAMQCLNKSLLKNIRSFSEPKKMLHHKLWLFDNKICITGSQNATNRGAYHNYENIVIFPSTKTAMKEIDKEITVAKKHSESIVRSHD